MNCFCQWGRASLFSLLLFFLSPYVSDYAPYLYVFVSVVVDPVNRLGQFLVVLWSSTLSIQEKVRFLNFSFSFLSCNEVNLVFDFNWIIFADNLMNEAFFSGVAGNWKGFGLFKRCWENLSPEYWCMSFIMIIVPPLPSFPFFFFWSPLHWFSLFLPFVLFFLLLFWTSLNWHPASLNSCVFRGWLG